MTSGNATIGTAFRRLAASLAAGMLLIGASASVRAQTADVSVSVNEPLGTLSPVAYGLNTATWDGNLPDAPVPGLIKNAGATILRYPGGSTSDGYFWEQDTGASNFDGFMRVANAAGATPIITVNYGSNAAGTGGGDPNEAAAWVAYAKSKNYHVHYWEIGNECYGGWEENLWPAALQTGTGYGTNALNFITAMKAQDPTIQIGAVLALPGQYDPWNQEVLQACGSKIDFVIIHWYPQGPGQESDPYLLSVTNQIAGMVSGTRALVNQYCGANASHVQIFLTESNSVYTNPGRQSISLVNAMFLADEMMTWLESGVTSALWWDLFNGATDGYSANSLYGTTDYGDYGILSTGGFPEPPADTPFPPYYGMQMLTHLGKPGDTMVASTSSNPGMITTHAVKQANGNLALMLINKDPVNTYTVSTLLNGFTPASTATSFTYGENSTAISSSTVSVAGSGFTTRVSPYSLTTLVLQPGTASGTTPAFTMTGSASLPTTAPGTSEKVSATLTDIGAALTNGIVTLSTTAPNQQPLPGQSFTAKGGTHTYTWNWITPQAPGDYSLNVSVTDSTGKILYAYQTVATVASAIPSEALDSAYYNFETGTQGFLTTGGLITGISAVTGPVTPFAGAQALAVNLNATGAQTAQVYVNAPPVGPSESVVFHVWIPSGSTLKSVTPYVIAGPAGRWLWSETAIAPSPGSTGRWLTIQIPTGVFPAYQLGVQFTTGAGTWSGTCYVDSIYW